MKERLRAVLAAHNRRAHTGACRTCRVATACLGAYDAERFDGFRAVRERPDGMYRRVVYGREESHEITAAVCTVCGECVDIVRIRSGVGNVNYCKFLSTALRDHAAQHAGGAAVRGGRVHWCTPSCTPRLARW